MAFNYKDPRWQKRRLEIMERDDFQCMCCGDKESELHVHHKRYKGQPWEAEDDDLQTLCTSCHEFLGRHPKAGIWYLPKKNIFLCASAVSSRTVFFRSLESSRTCLA